MRKQKFLAALLALVMLLSLVPVTAFAFTPTTSVSSSEISGGMFMNKNTELEDDGTYTINLEAFATGTTTVTETKESAPLDIVLVLDQSGSMAETFSSTSVETYELITRSYSSVTNSYLYSYYRDNLYLKLSDGTYSKVTIQRTGSNYQGYQYTYTAENGSTVSTGSNAANSQAPWAGQLYSLETGSSSITKKDALKTAVGTFLDQISEDAKNVTATTSHRVAIVGFGSGNSTDMGSYNNTKWQNTELLSTQNVVPYATTNNATSSSITNAQYQDALVPVNVDGSLNARLTTARDRIDASGATQANYGLEMAYNILNSRTETTYTAKDGSTKTRQTVVVFFTDGYPGLSADSNTDQFRDDSNYHNITTANAAIAQADKIKEAGTTIFSVGVLNGADPAASYNFTTGTTTGYNGYSYYTSGVQAANAFLHFVSSDYASATNMTTPDRTKVVNNGYYLAATSASKLNAVFDTISGSISNSGTTVTLTEEAVMKDILEPGAFKLPEGYSEDTSAITITLKSVTTTDGTSYTVGNAVAKNGDGTYTLTDSSNNTTANVNVSYTVNEDGNTIEITGFNYSKYFVAPSHAGYMVCVEISGIEVTGAAFDAAAGSENGTVVSNGDDSGIWQTPESPSVTFPFEQPTVKLSSKSYVMDYAKPFDMLVSEWGLNNASHIAANTAKIVAPSTAVDLTNGSVSKNNNGGYTYNPETMSWNGYDTFYAYGQGDNGNQWAKVNVLPANNVYYEDSFVSTNPEASENGSVQIVYNGNNTASNENAESQEIGSGKGVHGWEASLADDTQFSDGSALQMTTGATATFTFTGTGVDIYSYTDMTTGIVTAKLVDESGKEATKYLMVDNLAVSGEYYQIPTLFWNDLTYGTYTVTLVVNSAKAPETNADGSVKLDEDGNIVYSDTEKRSTYYLDGIRVYNPIQNLESTDTVKDAYGDEELNAVFESVRELMETGAVDGSTVFIDLDGQGNVGDATAYDTTEYGTYGPKNEVYLAPGQAITFKVSNSDNYFQIGLKAPEGSTSVGFSNTADTNSSTTIAHSTDLYYKVNPVGGMITIKNTGDTNILSVTKIKMTGPVTTSGADGTSGIVLSELTAEEATAELAAFTLRSSVEYTAESEVVEDVQPEEPDIDVDIENPTEPEEDPADDLAKLISRLFDMIFRWFGH